MKLLRAAELLLFIGLLPRAALAGARLRRLHWPAKAQLLAARGGTSPLATGKSSKPASCGPLPAYDHARPKNYEDAQKERYDPDTKQTVQVTFSAGDSVEFECVAGYSTDGSKEGSRSFAVACSDLGYYKPSGVCLEASKCGAIPTIPHAIPTGKEKMGRVEFACASGFSLDGEEVVAGGLGKNQLFELSCIDFSGEYEKFEGECKPYAFVPHTEGVRIYNQVFEALFIVSCKGTLRRTFSAGEGPPAGLTAACGKLGDASLQAQCAGLVTQVQADYAAQQQARQQHDEAAGKEWHEARDPDRPGIGDVAQEFCSQLWGLLAAAP
mmetsp:Transcript_36692/g.76990  ORF Transcript_36692/g.76990 Transcript_36692/m.76990 type:complete len:325 (-) Transcript_36692:104-1078(-)